MPIYTYSCKTCDETVEKTVAIERRDMVKCFKCNSKLVRKIDKPGLVWSPTRNGGHST